MVNNSREFIKECRDAESAVEFAEKVGGKFVSSRTVVFQGTYSISKAVYDVGRDMYKVYIRIRAVNVNRAFTHALCRKTSLEAYDAARKMVQKGVF